MLQEIPKSFHLFRYDSDLDAYKIKTLFSIAVSICLVILAKMAVL